MNWDQIENKWAAMTRRIRPDWSAAVKTGVASLRQGGDVAVIDTAAAEEPGRTDVRASPATSFQVE